MRMVHDLRLVYGDRRKNHFNKDMFACKTAFDFLGHFSVSSQYRRERFKNKLFLFETVCNLICVFVCFYLSYEDVIFVRFQIQRLLNCEKIKRCRNNFVSYCAVKVLVKRMG